MPMALSSSTCISLCEGHESTDINLEQVWSVPMVSCFDSYNIRPLANH